MNTKVLLIGGSGFVGQELAVGLVQAQMATTITTRSAQKVELLNQKNPLLKGAHVPDFSLSSLGELFKH